MESETNNNEQEQQGHGKDEIQDRDEVPLLRRGVPSDWLLCPEAGGGLPLIQVGGHKGIRNPKGGRGTEEDTGAMMDMEVKWYIVRDMGLVCNQAFLDEVDKAIIEEIKKKTG